MRYFTSDLHLFHELVFKMYRKKYNSIEEMHKDFIKEWNKKVQSKDLVYVIGDVSFGKFDETKEIITKLNGKKILIRGNHDERFTSAQWIDIGFVDVRDILVIKKDSAKWILCHYPYASSFKYFIRSIFGRKGQANYFKVFPSYKSYKLIHGHHHAGDVYHFDRVNVAWDINQTLLNENEVAEIFEKNKETKAMRVLKTLWSCFW
jgi:calcineurin-like phosphoesterase family protein